MRTLEPDIFITTVIVMTVSVLLVFFNIKLFLKHGRSKVNNTIYALSFVIVLILSLLMLDQVSFDLSLLPHPTLILRGLLILLILGFCYVLFQYYKKRPFHVPPDLLDAFFNIDDLIIIYDATGKVQHINQEHLLSLYFQSVCPAVSALPANRKNQFEMSIGEDFTLWVVVTPIITKLEHVGTAVVFYDITHEKKLYARLEKNNQLMADDNEKLLANLHVYAQFEVEKTKLEVLEELQENLVNRLERIVSKLHSEVTKEDLLKTSDELREIYQLVRASVKEIATRKGRYGYDSNSDR